MAVSEKRLFWIAIIVVELVALYIVWRPYRDRFMRPRHKIAVAAPAARPPQPTTPAMPTPELKPPAVIIASHRPWAGVRHNPKLTAKSLVVNAGLKVPEPIPAAPVPMVVPQSSSNAAETFWCDLAKTVSSCDCALASDSSKTLK